MVEGQEAHRLFEAPDLHEMAREGDLDGMRRLILSKDDDEKKKNNNNKKKKKKK